MPDSPRPSNSPAPSRITSEPISIVTASRLHFGLLRTESPFGGAGVMLENSQGVIQIWRSEHFDCDERYRSRIEPIVDRMVQHFGWQARPNCRVTVPTPFQSHVGLGSGTQLSMGVVHGLCQYSGEKFDPIKMATSLADRGKRSAVGVHGYAAGGMIVEDGEGDMLNPVINRIELPTVWKVGFLVPPAHETSISGDHEQKQFDRLPATADQQLNQLRSILVSELAPAAREEDFDRFASSLNRYNYESGRLFEAVQGGPYNGLAVSELIRRLQSLGAVGVGQSSWGPGVFCWFRSQHEAVEFVDRTRGQIPNLVIMTPQNRGADVV